MNFKINDTQITLNGVDVNDETVKALRSIGELPKYVVNIIIYKDTLTDKNKQGWGETYIGGRCGTMNGTSEIKIWRGSLHQQLRNGEFDNLEDAAKDTLLHELGHAEYFYESYSMGEKIDKKFLEERHKELEEWADSYAERCRERRDEVIR